MIEWRKFYQLDNRGRLLSIALILLGISLLNPSANLPKRVFDWYLVLDITQSMNVRDMEYSGKSTSRLAYSKIAMRDSLRALPCGSRVALGLFTERDTASVTQPLEVCAHFAALDETIEHFDWRMAWAADSYVINGLYSAIAHAPKLNDKNEKAVQVAFISDGHQAPPINPDYAPAFEGKVGDIKGVVIGVGGYQPSRIPKLDPDDNITGYWELEEVMRYATFGMKKKPQSALEMEHDQNSRNAPHGSNPAESTQAHLSALDETNLKSLANTTGLKYLRLNKPEKLADAMTQSNLAIWRKSSTDLRSFFALPAMVLILLFFIPVNSIKSWNFFNSLLFKRKNT